ncbi:LPS O-antigen length regulator Wzz(fepE) [Enterobacter roggenkampii]|uniref:LPS O-antigen length regulator Wzz(fepE) n=1 Tax=Enterobacter roggenkampii TaxID=1812935 RepID=UPI002DBC47FA|nr:LPS O-antigen length regulator Wzz(fepE) [Enterobacter roggenkampii]MEB5890293.1 LPS O-antigen length regulator Wzz(fepE) [Enterobacter roggenkampii]
MSHYINFRHTSSGEEVDLIAVLLILWKAKRHLLICICGFAFIGLLISIYLPQKWTSNAIVTSPEPTQWGQLQQQLAALQGLGVDVGIDRDEVFTLFLKKFSSQQEQEEYITTTPELIAQFREASVDAMDLRRAVAEISGRIKVVNDNIAKKNDSRPFNSWTLSFTGSRPQVTQSILEGYIQFVVAKVVKQSLLRVRNSVALKIQTEKDALDLERTKLVNTQDAKIKRLEYSLEIAKAAGISRPVYSNGLAILDDPDFSVTLGTNGIARKLEIEKSISDVSELDSGLRNRKYVLSLLKKIVINDMTFPVFRYQMSPSLPVKKDGPGTVIIVVLSMLMGAILACVGVLFSNSWTQRSSGHILSKSG